ncbi:MAG: hypothetical protein ACKVS7_06850, partial [Gemmatimonadaceae bacterium]
MKRRSVLRGAPIERAHADTLEDELPEQRRDVHHADPVDEFPRERGAEIERPHRRPAHDADRVCAP